MDPVLHRPEGADPWCRHRLVVDEDEWYEGVAMPRVWRVCLTCGCSYDRGHVLDKLRNQCERAWKVDFQRLSKLEGGLDDEDALEVAGW